MEKLFTLLALLFTILADMVNTYYFYELIDELVKNLNQT